MTEVREDTLYMIVSVWKFSFEKVFFKFVLKVSDTAPGANDAVRKEMKMKAIVILFAIHPN